MLSSGHLPSVLWRCWLGGRKGIRPVKNWVVRCWCGYLSGARCRLAYAQLMPLPPTISCSSKIQIGFTFLVPAHPGSPGQRAFKRVCVCVCIGAYITQAHYFGLLVSNCKVCCDRCRYTCSSTTAHTAGTRGLWVTMARNSLLMDMQSPFTSGTCHYLQLCMNFNYVPVTVVFSALTLLVGQQEGHRPVTNSSVKCWHGYLSGARCRLAYGPPDATVTHCLFIQ